MRRQKAIEKIMTDLHLGPQFENFVLQTIGELGCGEEIDSMTVRVIKQIIDSKIKSQAI